MSKKFIILGAGPCGLATAFGLTLNEIDLEVYEARDVVGGLGGSRKLMVWFLIMVHIFIIHMTLK